MRHWLRFSDSLRFMRSFKSKFPSSLFLALLFNTLNLLDFRVISLYSFFINAACRARCKWVNLCVRNIYHVQLYNLIVWYCFVQDTCGVICTAIQILYSYTRENSTICLKNLKANAARFSKGRSSPLGTKFTISHQT